MIARGPAQRGSLLIITLWLVLILGSLATAIGRFLSLEVKLTKYRLAREQAKTLARSGVYLAMQRVARDAAEDTVDWTEDDWAYSADAPWVVVLRGAGSSDTERDGTLEITIVDEDRRLDLNSQLATAAILDTLSAAGIGQAIVDYRDRDEEPPDTQSQPPYHAKNKPASALEELLEIPEVRTLLTETPETLAVFLDRVTVYTAREDPNRKPNGNTALEPVLLAVSAIDPAILNRFAEARGAGPDGLGGGNDCLLNADDPNNAQALAEASCVGDLNAASALIAEFSGSSSVFRVTAKGIVSDPSAQYRVEAVVRRSEKPDERPVILAWTEG